MKTRLGLLVLVAVLAGCSAQDNGTKSAQQAADSTLGTNAKAVSGIARYANDSKRSIGSAPDRGELFTYRPDAKALREGAYTLRPVSLSEEHAIRAAVTGVMAVPGPDGKDIKIAYERHEEHPDGNWSWIGRVIGGDQAQEAIFTFGQDAVFGSIPQANGPALKLATERGIAYLVQADPSKLFRGHRAGGDVKVASSFLPNLGVIDSSSAPTGMAKETSRPDLDALDSSGSLTAMVMAKATSTTTAHAAAADVSAKAVGSVSTVDLVAGYSNGLAARLGSDGAAITRLNQLVVAANQALINSQINARIRLVGAVKVNYADNTDNGAALDQLTGFDGDNAVTIPAALAPLRALRETAGADLVTLVRDFQQTNDGCGIAWLIGDNGRAIVPGTDAPFGYSIVSDGDYDLNGNTYFCEDITLVHELAHNMGSAHDIANADGTPGRFPYSYGYKTTAAAGNFFTVMAYGDDNQTLYRVFSNPAITTCGGRACGVANQANNALSLNQTTPVVAGFRSSLVAPTSPARPYAGRAYDANADGRADLIWHSQSLKRVQPWLMNGSAWTYGSVHSIASQYYVVGIGDFNNDGRADILWRDATKLWQWQAKADGTYQIVYMRSWPTGWEIVGVDDSNADGRSDIYWHNQTQGKLQTWLMNGTAFTFGPVQSLANSYRVVGVGDFNNDKRADILWADDSSLWQWQARSTGGYNSVRLGGYPAGWQVVGVDDANADGRADIFWHNKLAGRVQTWLMNGTTWVYGPENKIGSQYNVVSIGDFDNNNRADIMWADATKLWQWKANTSGTYTSIYLRGYPSGYAEVN